MLSLGCAHTAVSGRDYSVVATLSPTLRAAGLSGNGQNTEHGCMLWRLTKNFQRTLQLRASNEAQRQLAFDIEVTSQRTVPELTGS